MNAVGWSGQVGSGRGFGRWSVRDGRQFMIEYM